MKVKHIKDEQLQNYILNKIEQVYMLENGLYTKSVLIRQPYIDYDYKSLREAVANDLLGRGYYKLVKLFEQEGVRGVKQEWLI